MVQLYANNKTGVANSPTVTVVRPTANLNIQCDNIVNPPSGEFIFTTYRTMSDGDGGQIVDPSSIREMTGTSSGNIITISAFAPGNTDIGNQVGDRVVFRPGAHWANTVAERLDETGNWAVNQDKLAATVADMTSPDNWILPNTGIISQVSGLIGAFSDIQYYISGKKYSKTGIANKTYTATKDTYVSINAAGVVTYTEVTVGAAAPAVPANSVVAARVTTSGSAITSVVIKSHGAITASKIDLTSLYSEATLTGTMSLTNNGSFTTQTLSGLTSGGVYRITVEMRCTTNGTRATSGGTTTFTASSGGSGILRLRSQVTAGNLYFNTTGSKSFTTTANATSITISGVLSDVQASGDATNVIEAIYAVRIG